MKWVFCDLRVLVRKLASAFGHPTQVSTQVQLAPTYDYLPVRLTRALDYFVLEPGEKNTGSRFKTCRLNKSSVRQVLFLVIELLKEFNH